MAVDPNWKPTGTLTGDGLEMSEDIWQEWRAMYKRQMTSFGILFGAFTWNKEILRGATFHIHHAEPLPEQPPITVEEIESLSAEIRRINEVGE